MVTPASDGGFSTFERLDTLLNVMNTTQETPKMLSLTTPSQTAWLRPESLDHKQHGQQMDAEFRRQASCHAAIVIDCGKLQTIGSTGTGRLVNWLRDAAAQNVRVGVANVTPSLRALFDLTSLSSVLPAMPASAMSASTGRAA